MNYPIDATLDEIMEHLNICASQLLAMFRMKRQDCVFHSPRLRKIMYDK